MERYTPFRSINSAIVKGISSEKRIKKNIDCEDKCGKSEH